LQQFEDKQKQKAEVLAYFKKYDEAENMYKDIDRKDLALELRTRLGDWAKVV
jgi:WD repeat-containing protein 35